MTITVLSVEQGNASDWSTNSTITPSLLKSRFNKTPYVFKHVFVPDTDQSDAGRIPAAVIQKAVRDTPGEKILLLNSTGNSYAFKAIRDGAFDGIRADELTFWCLANPERKYGGWCRVPTPTRVSWNISPFGGVGVPDGIPWKMHDFAQRYDVVGDAATAVSPGSAYQVYAQWVGLWLHLNYFTVSPDEPVTKKYVEGNITYYLHSPHIDAGYEKFYTRPNFV